MHRERVMKFVIPPGAKAHSRFTAMMYGLKPVPFKTPSNGVWADAVPFKTHCNDVMAEAVPFKSLQRVKA
jgi:hypothetical protein